jgi:hypothetical protein
MATVFGKGVTLANFHTRGTFDSRKDALIMFVMAGGNISENVFKTHAIGYTVRASRS